jgi:hypothetical protein
LVVGQFISSPCQGAAFTVGSALPIAAAVLLIFYPAWDAAANVLDAQRNGGLKRNPTQAVNALLSLVGTLAIRWPCRTAWHVVSAGLRSALNWNGSWPSA